MAEELPPPRTAVALKAEAGVERSARLGRTKRPLGSARRLPPAGIRSSCRIGDPALTPYHSGSKT
jgi:hypothetical protein